MRDWRDLGETERLLLAALLGLAILLVAGTLFAQPVRTGEPLDPRRALAVSQAAVGRTLGDYTFTDTDGQPVRLARYRGKPLILSFIYTGCFQVCPTATAFLNRAVDEAQRALGPGTFNVATIGFNLPFDTPAAMRDFRRRQGIRAEQWTFLAGDAASVEGLAHDAGFSWAPTASGFDHVTQVTIVDGSGRVVRQVYGESFELPMLIGPLKELATGAPASAQSVGDLLERVRILCTVYDPREGRYRLNYGLFIEIFAGLTVLGATLGYLIAGVRRGRGTRRAVAAPDAPARSS